MIKNKEKKYKWKKREGFESTDKTNFIEYINCK